MKNTVDIEDLKEKDLDKEKIIYENKQRNIETTDRVDDLGERFNHIKSKNKIDDLRIK